MEGPGLVHAAWLLSLVLVWFLRRFVEKTGPDSPEFTAFCRERPLLAALQVTPGEEGTLAEALRRALGKRQEVVATLAGWPWIHHALKVEIVASAGALHIQIVASRVVRTGERALPALIAALNAFAAEHREHVLACWLHPQAYIDVTGEVSAAHGWRVDFAQSTPPCQPFADRPSWARPLQLGVHAAPELALTAPRSLRSLTHL